MKLTQPALVRRLGHLWTELVDRARALSFPLQLLCLAIVSRLAALLAGDHVTLDDENVYSSIATRILEGERLYEGAVDHKPPGIMVTYAALYALFGRYQLLPVRVLLCLVVVATALVLARAAARVIDERAAKVSGFLYVAASVWGSQYELQAANCELFLNLPMVGAAYLVLNRAPGQGRWCFLLAGLLTAIAGLYKYQACLFGVGWAVMVVADARLSWRERLARLAGLATGFALACATFLATMYASGAWDAFVFWGWGYNFEYMDALSTGDKALRAILHSAGIAAFWLPLWFGMGRLDARLRWTMLPWFGAALLVVAQGGRFFTHYYLVALPALCVLAAPALLRAGRRARVARGLAVCFSAASLVLSTTMPEVPREQRLGDEANLRIAAWIRAHTGPDDRVFAWGGPGNVYHLADRVMGSRFPSSNYHTGKIWGTPLQDARATGTEAYRVPRAWTELAQDLVKSPPLLILDMAAAGLHGFAGQGLDRYPRLAAFVARHYWKVAEVDGAPIYRRRTAPYGEEDRTVQLWP